MTAVDVPTSVPKGPARASLFRRLLRRPVGLASLIFLALIAVIAVIGGLLAPYDPNQASL